MPPAINLGRPQLVQSDGGVELDRRTSIAVGSALTAGSDDVSYFVYKSADALRGEDYPALVRVWDNDTDALYDTL